jgi:hypothetical protein
MNQPIINMRGYSRTGASSPIMCGGFEAEIGVSDFRRFSSMAGFHESVGGFPRS